MEKAKPTTKTKLEKYKKPTDKKQVNKPKT